MIIALLLVTQGAVTSTAALGSFPVLQYPVIWLGFLNQVLLFLVPALFPTGRFVPKWIRWIVLVWIVYVLANYPLQFAQQMSWYPAFQITFNFVFMGILIIAQIYRYRSVSTPVQRQQTKWVVLAIATITVAYVVLSVPSLFNPTLYQYSSLYSLIAFNIFHFVLLLGPVSIYIAIVRYRLYDIDVIINRSLVYGMLTACVVALYLLMVVGFGALLHRAGGSDQRGASCPSSEVLYLPLL